MNQPVNAWEPWTLYDSVLISTVADTIYSGQGFFNSYAALSAPAQIPFLNVRNKSAVGEAYNNFDSRDKLPYVYHAYTIGISFEAPSVTYGAIQTGQSEGAILFANEIVKHCGFVLKVSQDEKLVHTAELMPNGQGVTGWGTSTEIGGAVAPTIGQNVSSGQPDKDNKWPFPNPIEMPREVNISGTLVISPYGKSLLAKMVGPGTVRVSEAGATYPAAALLRVSLGGFREVQQRNALHYGVQ